MTHSRVQSLARTQINIEGSKVLTKYLTFFWMLAKLQPFSQLQATILSSYQQIFGLCYFFTALGQSLTSN